MDRREWLGLLVWLVAIGVAVTVMTAIWSHKFATDCRHDGGTYSVEGGSIWCRY